MKACAFFLVTIMVLLCTLPGAYAMGVYPAYQTGHDVSWPNCRATPPDGRTFGIVGVTGGLVFHPNPCLFEEVHWFNKVSLYMNTGYAGKALAVKYASYPQDCAPVDERCLAYNYGYNAGVYAINYAASQFVHNNVWWLDVETENSWSTNTEYNRASLLGMVAAIKQRTLLPTIGFYSYPGQWMTITGSWQNRYPAWAATGSDDSSAATALCGVRAFNGTQTQLTQYTTRLDDDYVCN